MMQYAIDAGCLPATTVSAATTASSYFPLADANGNAVTYSDDAGNVQAHYVYDAFGGTVSQSGDNMADVFRFRFSSKYLDDETEFYYYGFRYFCPGLGRWVCRDPIEERGGLLLYGFVGNNGVNKLDVSGFMTYPKRTRDEAASGELYFDPDFEYEGTGKPTTFYGAEFQFFGGFGMANVTCCDEKLIQHKMTFYKVCIGLDVGIAGSGGGVEGMDGPSCKPESYSGWFFETGISIPGWGVGADFGYNDMWKDDKDNFLPPLPGDRSDVVEGGGGPSVGLPVKLTWCRYYLLDEVTDECACRK